MNGKKMIRTKKKNSLKSFKKKIIKLFTLLKKEFLNLDKTFRFLIIMWSVILLILVLLLVVYGVHKKNVSVYRDVEEQMDRVALKYVESQEVYPTESSPLRLSLDLLLENGAIDEDVISRCSGYSKIVYNDDEEEYEVNSYLSCKSYTTNGYSSNK